MKAHRDFVRELIASVRPDIVCFQETKIQTITDGVLLSTLGTSNPGGYPHSMERECVSGNHDVGRCIFSFGPVPNGDWATMVANLSVWATQTRWNS